MLREIRLNLKEDKFNKTAPDIQSLKQILEDRLTSNSLEDEISEFFREVAALKGQSVHDLLSEMIIGTQKYLEAVNTTVEFKNGIPVDVNKFADKLENLSRGIESCWDIFSEESRYFFINLAKEFCEASAKFQGWKGLLIRWQLFIPSLQQKDNLFKKYRDSFLKIPKAVNKAIEIRDSKTTAQLKKTAGYLRERTKELSEKQQSLLPSLKHLGRDKEEQIEKNQAAMVWAKARLKEIEGKRNRRNS